MTVISETRIARDPPIVSDKLYIVSVMTSLDTVDTDGVAICRVARPTPETQRRRFRHVDAGKSLTTQR